MSGLTWASRLLAQAAASATAEGLAHRRDGRWEAALEAYRRVPDPPPFRETSDRTTREEGRKRHQDRAEAQWGIAVCLLRLERPAEAPSSSGRHALPGRGRGSQDAAMRTGGSAWRRSSARGSASIAGDATPMP